MLLVRGRQFHNKSVSIQHALESFVSKMSTYKSNNNRPVSSIVTPAGISYLNTGNISCNPSSMARATTHSRSPIDLFELQTSDLSLTVVYSQEDFNQVLGEEDVGKCMFYPDKFPALFVQCLGEIEDSGELYRNISRAMLSVQCRDVKYIALLLNDNEDIIDSVVECLLEDGARYEIDPRNADTGQTCSRCHQMVPHSECDTDGPVRPESERDEQCKFWSVSVDVDEYPSPHYDFFVYILAVGNNGAFDISEMLYMMALMDTVVM